MDYTGKVNIYMVEINIWIESTVIMKGPHTCGYKLPSQMQVCRV